MMGNFTRPSWAVMFLLLALVTFVSLQRPGMTVFPIWLRSSSSEAETGGSEDSPSCSGYFQGVTGRRFVMSIKDFGGVGDGRTSNTESLRKAIRYMQRFGGTGGSQLNIPRGRWLTGSFNLTSNFTLFLEEGAVILGSQDPKEWPLIEPLPSYGRGRERSGGRHISLIHGNGLQNVVITGQNGTVDGQGNMWWELWWNKTLEHTRGHLLELMNSENVLVSNLTFRNSPFWTIHPIYCRNVVVKGMTILAPLNAPNTDGVDPDSSTNVCIEDNYIESGDDLVAIKSGWDQYGITMARPSTNIVVRRVSGTTPTCSGVGIGSEMSGGISNITIQDLHVWNSAAGVRIKSDYGRGGYIANVTISDIRMERVKIPIKFSRGSNDHPDDGWDPKAVPEFKRILISNVTSVVSAKAALMEGIKDASYEDLCFKNITLMGVRSSAAWHCEYISGFASEVFPVPCPELHNNGTSSWCLPS
ncbi:probable polygalacturonase [Neltuma alba]|uniref:probable polygalacturonase n=1 Tax=Neltuma alba TaxID=207710 RepID=UPI0010A4FF5C|nr:probable polygalacturonase [Prosopis alba]